MRDPRTMTVAERKAEEQRQAQALTEAIQTAIQQVASDFDTPMLNAVAGALVTVEAGVLAACDPAGRKALRKAMEASRPVPWRRRSPAPGRVASRPWKFGGMTHDHARTPLEAVQAPVPSWLVGMPRAGQNCDAIHLEHRDG